MKKSKKNNKINRWKGTGSYTFQKRLPNKDNRMIYDPLPGDGYYDKQLSLSEYVEYSSKIRVPSLKRKSAWKRFYKLYPHLKGKKVICGSTSSWSEDFGINRLNASTIKLKKVKK